MALLQAMILAMVSAGLAGSVQAAPPAWCAKAGGEVEKLICKDAGLSALDEKMATTYSDALKRADVPGATALKNGQKDFERRRDACAAKETAKCVRETYARRIAEVQARYKLLPGHGPFKFACDGNPKNVVQVIFYDTSPQTLVAEWGDKVSLMYEQPSASGAKYEGPNETFWEHHGVTRIIWGRKTSEMYCKPTA
jgi:uncharacterized protein